MPAEYRYFDGTLRQGYFCRNCGQTCNMLATGHHESHHGELIGWICTKNPTLVRKLMRANPVFGEKPHYVYSHKKTPMTNESGPSWKNTFNAHLKLHGWIGKAFEAARVTGYPFIAWNGWVYPVHETKSSGGEDDRIMLVEDLK